MIGRNKFQYRIATGRITLPAAILLAVIVCLINTKQLTDGITLGVCAVMAYMLIEMNTAFALIRTRTAFPPAMFMLFSQPVLSFILSLHKRGFPCFSWLRYIAYSKAMNRGMPQQRYFMLSFA